MISNANRVQSNYNHNVSPQDDELPL